MSQRHASSLSDPPIRPHRPFPLPVAVLLSAVAFAWLMFLWEVAARPLLMSTALVTSTSTAATGPAPSTVLSAPSAYPPELLMAAVAQATYYAPTPIPTPTLIPPTRMPTVVPVMCGMGSQTGELCQWPRPTALPPTPYPICQTPIPSEECVWDGRAGAPTPLPVILNPARSTPELP